MGCPSKRREAALRPCTRNTGRKSKTTRRPRAVSVTARALRSLEMAAAYPPPRRRGNRPESQMKRSMLSFAFALTAVLGGAGWTHAGQNPNAGGAEIQILPVQGNVYMLASPAGNITVQAGNDGVLVVDTGIEQSAPKVIDAIRKISDKPILWVIDTDVDPEHVGGNAALPRLANTAGQRARIIAHD